MAKKLKRKQNKKNWNKGLRVKEVTLGINSSNNRKGQILT